MHTQQELTEPNKTAAGIIMKAYFENGCKAITENKAKSLPCNGLAESTLIKKWKELQRDQYNCTDETNNELV